jgi:DNA-binding PadR family transcriptional regulator
MVSLAGGPKHGYAIMDDIEQLSGIRFGPGTLYGALARLENLGLIESLPAQDRRLPYQLTRTGRVALRWHLAGVRRFVDIGLARLAEQSTEAPTDTNVPS